MINDKRNISYIFELNDDDERSRIDGMKKSNAARWINHSQEGFPPNLRPEKWLTMHGNHVMGLFAEKKMYAETELNFNYGEHAVQMLQGHDA